MRIPVYRQLESSDCGPVCIQMISAYYGKIYNTKTIKTLCQQTRIGISIQDVIHCMTTIGFEAVCVNISLEEAYRMPLPAILYLKHGHFIVLEKISSRHKKTIFTIIDPAYGRVRLSKEKLSEKWLICEKGVAVVISPKDDFMKIHLEDNEGKGNKGISTMIIGVMRKYRKQFIGIFFLTIIVLCTSWAMPLLLGKTIDEGILQKDIHIVWILLLSQFAFFIGYMVSDNITDLITAKTSIQINLDLISSYLKKLIRLPMLFIDSTFRSDLIQRLRDQERLGSFITDNIIGMIFIILNIINDSLKI